jgi:hypothetical protein
MSGAYRRPLGITILAVLTAFTAVLTVVAGIVVVLALWSSIDPLRLLLFVGLIVAFTALAVVVGYGFVEITPWGWPLGIAYFGIDLVWGLVSNGFTPSLDLVLDIVVLAYLLRPSVRKSFVGWATA